jgi:hypothetical protein
MNTAAGVDAVSGGAAITRPPPAVLSTLSPEKSRCTSAAEGGGTGAGAVDRRTSRDSSPAARMASISGSAGRSSGSAASAPRSGAAGEGRRHDLLDPGQEAARPLERHLVSRPVEEPGEESLLRPHQNRAIMEKAGSMGQVAMRTIGPQDLRIVSPWSSPTAVSRRRIDPYALTVAAR